MKSKEIKAVIVLCLFSLLGCSSFAKKESIETRQPNQVINVGGKGDQCVGAEVRAQHCKHWANKILRSGGWKLNQSTLKTASASSAGTGSNEVYNCTYIGDVTYPDGSIATQAGFAGFRASNCDLAFGGGSVEIDQ